MHGNSTRLRGQRSMRIRTLREVVSQRFEAKFGGDLFDGQLWPARGQQENFLGLPDVDVDVGRVLLANRRKLVLVVMLSE